LLCKNRRNSLSNKLAEDATPSFLSPILPQSRSERTIKCELAFVSHL
jgi:hypothetical protein